MADERRSTARQIVVPVRMPRQLYEDLAVMASRDERTKSSMLRKLLGEAVREWRKSVSGQLVRPHEDWSR